VRTLYVDAMNVIGTRPDGWWRDRDGAVVRLVDRLGVLATADADLGIVVVVDGRPITALPAGRHGEVEVVYARRTGADAADDRIVELLAGHRAADMAGSATVVTADRDLRARSRALGATIMGPRELLDRLDHLSA
jgi:predicted RNA-binding protein with PIN domain